MRVRQDGFTLIELMIALTMAAILLMVAVPGFRDTVKRNAIESMVTRLKSALTQAKTEALSRGYTVSICSSDDGSSCGSDWSIGWIVFVDNGAGASGSVNNAGNGDREVDEAIISYQNISDESKITALDAGGAITSLSFNRLGYLGSDSASTFVVCSPDAEVEFARGIVLLISGQLAHSRDSAGDSDTVHEDTSGSNFTCT